MMKSLFLCIILFCGNLWAQSSIQETIDTSYSPWSVSAFSLLVAQAEEVSNGGDIFSYNYIGPNYRLNFNERLAFKVPFIANTAGYDDISAQCSINQDMSLADPFVNYSNYNVPLLPSFMSTYWDGRIYLPLSKSSRAQKMIGRLRSNFIFSKLITQRLSFEWRQEFNYYHQSQSTYFAQGYNDDCQLVTNGGPSNTRRFRMDNWLTFWYRIETDWRVGLGAIFREDIRNDSATVETSRQRNGRLKEISACFGPNLKWIANNNVSFIVGIRDCVEYSGYHPERQDEFEEMGQFKAENTEYSLSSFIRF